MTAEDFTRALSTLARDLQAEPDEEHTLERLTKMAVGLIDGCSSASVTLRSRRGQHRSAAATDDATILADLRQYELTEGPCFAASTEETDIYSGDLEHDGRWPRWGPEAVALGFRSAMAIQLFTSEHVFGALNLYGTTRYAFSRDMKDVVHSLAAHAAVALAAKREVDGLNVAVHNRTVIGQAQGIVMERFGLDSRRAFELLSRLSSMQERRISAIAQEIVDTRTVPTQAPGARGPLQ